MLVLTVAENLDKLFQDSSLTAVTALSELGRVVEMTVDLALMFVIRVLGTKDSRADRTCEVFDMVFAFQCRDVGPTKSTTTFMAQKAEASKVVSFAERVLNTAVFRVDGEEFRGNNFTAILYFQEEFLLAQGRAFQIPVLSPFPRTYIAFKALQMKRATKRSYKLAGQRLIALLTETRRGWRFIMSTSIGS